MVACPMLCRGHIVYSLDGKSNCLHYYIDDPLDLQDVLGHGNSAVNRLLSLDRKLQISFIDFYERFSLLIPEYVNSASIMTLSGECNHD
jgi:hypothetical protein